MSKVMGKKYQSANKIISFIMVLCLVFGCFMSAPIVSNAAGADPANNGLDLGSLTPIPGIVFGGEGITNGMGFQGNYYFLSKSNMDGLRSGTITSGALGLGDSSWFKDTIYSAYDEHDPAGNYYYLPICGIDLIDAAGALGISSANIDITAYGSDGYTRTLTNAFTDRFYFASGATESSVVVSPALALQSGNSGSVSAATDCQTVAFGQSSNKEITHCNWVSSVNRIRFGTENTAALTITPISGSQKVYAISSLVNMGVYQTSYSYYASGSSDLNTHNLTGVPLSVVLSNAGISVGSDQKIVTGSTDAYTKTIPYGDISKWFVAYDGYNASGAAITNASSLRLYGPGTYGNEVVVKNLNSLSIQSTTSGGGSSTSGGITGGGVHVATKAAFTDGDDISNEVFFIAVKPTTGAITKYYYFTKAELEAYETTKLFHYDDHSTIKDVTAKGAKLSDLLDDLDIDVDGNLMIQYLEADGYHAQVSQATAYQDKVSWLTTSHALSIDETYDPMNTVIAYGINEQYASPTSINVNDQAGVYKDADNNSGYLRAYRDRGDANSTILKYLVGVAISPAGNLANANTGFTLQAKDATGTALTLSADVTSTIKGLITGMKYSVSAPKVVGATLKAGESSTQVITVGTGTTSPAIFTYTENPYFYVQNSSSTTNYTYSQLKTGGTQVPTALASTPYGYSSPMFYRYNGMWLSDMLSGISNISSVKFIAKSGAETIIQAADIGKYFIAYNNTESKGSTNTPEEKRVTKAFDDAKIIIPADGTVLTSSAILSGGAVTGNNAATFIAEADGVVITTTAPNKAAFTDGDDISQEVFFIAVKPTTGAITKYYYFTKAELEAYETTKLFHYDDHSTIKDVTAKGAKLSDLLDDLDIDVDGNLMIQYLEADGYHAQASQATAYQDKVSWLTTSHALSIDETYDPMNTVIAYGINEQYASPTSINVNDQAGVYKDADNNSGYLRAYRDRGDANSTILKYLVGVAISPAGNLANANTGFTLQAKDATGTALTLSADVTSTIKGLITGMKYSVSAPKVVGATLKAGESSTQVITVGTGTTSPAIFTYTENPYFYIQNGSGTTNYTYSQLKTGGTQVPTALASTPYGYSSPMFYRYNGMWLSDMLSGINNISSVKFIAKSGAETIIQAADIGKYFIAYNNTESKGSTNTPEEKRVTKAFDDAKIIIPADGTVLTSSAILSGGAVTGSNVTTFITAADGVVITLVSAGSGSSSGGGGGGGGGGGTASPATPTGDTLKPTETPKGAPVFSASVSATPTVDGNGRAVATVSTQVLNDALKKAIQAALESKDESAVAEVKIEIKGGSDLKAVESSIPVTSVKQVAESNDSQLTVATPILNMTFDTAALRAIANELGGTSLEVAAAIVDRSKLTLAPEDKDRDILAVYDLSLTSNGKNISSFGTGQANISIPWTPGSNQDPAGFYVSYIDENGKAHRVSGSGYNAKTGCVEFGTGHYSNYAIAYDANAASIKFKDVAGHWAESAVNFVVGENLFQGTSENTFDANGSMTRAMFVTVLGRASGVDISKYQKTSFGDVKLDSWYGGYVEWAAQNGIVSGFGNGTFNPNQAITREQMAMILNNYYKLETKVTQTASAQMNYSDAASISSWAKDGVSFCISKGFIAGYPDITFRPGKTATRAEVATILSRCTELF